MRKWLKELVENQYLPAIAALEDSSLGRSEAQRWAKLMKEQWATHGLKALKQQRNLMTEVRAARRGPEWGPELGGPAEEIPLPLHGGRGRLARRAPLLHRLSFSTQFLAFWCVSSSEGVIDMTSRNLGSASSGSESFMA